MPTYQYACTECGHAFDQVQSFSDDALTECPACSGRLRKLYNAVGVVFKGSGFYRNDSRTTTEGGSSSSSETSGDTKTETKTETKADSKGDSTAKPAASETKAAPKTESKPAASSSASTS